LGPSKLICISCIFRGKQAFELKHASPHRDIAIATNVCTQRCAFCRSEFEADKLFYRTTDGHQDHAVGICPACVEYCVCLLEQELALLTMAANEVADTVGETEARVSYGSLRDWTAAETELNRVFDRVDALINRWRARLFTTALEEGESERRTTLGCESSLNGCGPKGVSPLEDRLASFWCATVDTEYPANLSRFPVAERLALLLFCAVQHSGSPALRFQRNAKQGAVFIEVDESWKSVFAFLSEPANRRMLLAVCRAIREQTGFPVRRPRGRIQRYYDEQLKQLRENARWHLETSRGDAQPSSDRSILPSLRALRVQVESTLRIGDERLALRMTLAEYPDESSELWCVTEIRVLECDQAGVVVASNVSPPGPGRMPPPWSESRKAGRR
jgi:hypothetical protein